ncbi:MAG: HEAT repeat domain-containing protein, partial [Planctomycetota bacterium]
HQKARKIARIGPREDPVEGMLTASTVKQVTYDTHVRAWSWFEVFTKEEREPFVRFIGMLRRANEPRAAAKAAWGQPPELVDERWREFVLGKRRDLAASEKEKETETDVSRAGSKERANIANERDLQLLASRIRGLERCQSIPSAKLLVSLVDRRDSDRVREVIALVLDATKDPEVTEYLRGEGYGKAGNLGRAALCRMFGRNRDTRAVPLLRKALGDSFWLVRANAARSLSQLRHLESTPALTEMAAKSPNGKLRIAAMDALAELGGDARSAIPLIERNLMHRAWQVRVATCQTVARIGDTAAVDMLIGRLEREGGRVHDEIRRALKRLTGIERRWSAETWRRWWVKAKKWSDLERRSKAALEAEGKQSRPKRHDGYARKERRTVYYGIKVYARTVGYVLDTSASMKQGFQVSDWWQKHLGRSYTATTRIGVCQQELGFSVGELDPRTRFNLYFFNDRARAWQSVPVPAGSMADSGVGAAKAVTPTGQTNYYAALKLVLGAEGGPGGWSAAFADTPDTLFFLTDGLPTVGEITKADELLSWFRERNRFARLRVHVIAMGRAGLDPDFLKAFAEGNDGIFIHFAGSH